MLEITVALIDDNMEIKFYAERESLEGIVDITWFDHHGDTIETIELSLDTITDEDGTIYFYSVTPNNFCKKIYTGLCREVNRLIEKYDHVGYPAELNSML